MRLVVYIPYDYDFVTKSRLDGKDISTWHKKVFENLEDNEFFDENKEVFFEILQSNKQYFDFSEKPNYKDFKPFFFSNNGDFVINLDLFGKNPVLNEENYNTELFAGLMFNTNEFLYESQKFTQELTTIEQVLSYILETNKSNVLKEYDYRKLLEKEIQTYEKYKIWYILRNSLISLFAGITLYLLFYLLTFNTSFDFNDFFVFLETIIIPSLILGKISSQINKYKIVKKIVGE